ncbi:MAG: hypothetical protein U0003_03815 [Vampirovibrionales bacterium]
MPAITPKPFIQRLAPYANTLWANAAQAFNLKRMPTQDQVLFWSGFMYVPSALLTPAVSNWQLKQANMPVYERNLIVQTEVVRQAIGAAAHFVGFFGGLLLFGLGGKPNTPKTFQKLIGSVLGATVSYAFVRPWLVNAYTAQWVQKNRPKVLLSRAFFSDLKTQQHTTPRPTEPRPMEPRPMEPRPMEPRPMASQNTNRSFKPLLFQAYAGPEVSLPNKQANTKPPSTLAMA